MEVWKLLVELQIEKITRLEHDTQLNFFPLVVPECIALWQCLIPTICNQQVLNKYRDSFKYSVSEMSTECTWKRHQQNSFERNVYRHSYLLRQFHFFRAMTSHLRPAMALGKIMSHIQNRAAVLTTGE